MRRNKLFILILATLFFLIALALVISAFLDFQLLKSLADSLMSDGNFKSLNANNVLVFRALLVGFGLCFAIAGGIIGGGYFPQVIAGVRHYYLDLRHFFQALQPKKVDILPIIILLVVIACATVIRLQRMNDEISHDEAYTYVVFSSTSYFNIITNYHLPNNHILNSILIYFSTHLFGGQPWAVRLPAILAGLAVILAIYWLARQIYDKYTALLGSILVTVLPGAIIYSTRGRGYALVSLFTLLSLLLSNYIRKKNNLFAWSLLAITSALGFYSVPVMLFPFVIVFIWLFCEKVFDSSGPFSSKIYFFQNWLLTGATTAVLVLLLYTPIFIYSGVKSVFANQFVQPKLWQGYLASLPNMVSAVWQSWTNGFPLILSIILLIGFFLSLILTNRITRNRFPIQAAAFIGIAIMVLIQRPAGETKVWAFLQAPFMMWCAAGIVGLVSIIHVKSSKKIIFASVPVGIALLILLVMTVRIIPTIHAAWFAKGPAEVTASAINDQILPNDLIIVDSPYDAPIWYYEKLDGLPEAYFNPSRPFDRLFVIVNPPSGQTLQSVLQARGPDAHLCNVDKAQLAFSIGFLDTYIVPHR